MFTHPTPTTRTDQGGFSLAEVLVTIVVLSIGMLGSAGMQTAALQANSQTRYQVVAAALASELAEAIRGPGSIRAALFSPLSVTGFEDGCSTSSDTKGMCLPAGPGEMPVWATVSFTDADRTVEFGEYTGRQYAAGTSGVQPERAPHYLIEVIEDHSPGSNAGVARHLYRVSAVGFGPREETQVMLQMFFRKE